MSIFYFLLGGDLYARQEQLTKWLDKWLEPEWRELNLERFDGSQPASATLDAWLTPPFWGERRVVLAEGGSEALQSLLEALAALCAEKLPDTQNILVIHSESLDKRKKAIKELLKLAEVCEFQEIKRWNVQQELYPWIEEQVRRSGKRITRTAIDLLVQACGSDKFALRQALDKLLIYLGEQNQIEAEAVSLLVSHKDSDIFLWLETIASQDQDKAFAHLQTLLQKDNASKILSTLATLFNRVFQARWLAAQQTPQPEIAQLLGLNPYVLKKDLERWRSHPLERLEAGMHELLELQTRTRSSRLEPELALEIWLGNLLQRP